MMIRFNPYAMPNLFTAAFLFMLGLFVFLKNPKVRSNGIFFLLCCSGVVWHIGFFMTFSSVSASDAQRWNRLVYVGVPFITPLMYHFSVSFLRIRRQRTAVLLFYVIASAFVFLSGSPLFITGMRSFFWGYYKVAGPLYLPFIIFWASPAVLVLRNFYCGLKGAASVTTRQSIRYMFIALAVSIIGVLDFIPGYGVELYPVGFALIVACLSIIAYAILKHQLMDVRVTITRTGIFIAIYTFVLGLPFVLIAVAKETLVKALGDQWWLFPLALTFVLATAGTFLYIYLQKKAEALLLREQRRYHETLKKVGMEMTRIRHLDGLLRFILESITSNVHIMHAAFYLSEDGGRRFAWKVGQLPNHDQPHEITSESRLIEWFHAHRDILVYDEVKRSTEEEGAPAMRELEQQMRKLHAAVAVPHFLEDNLLGVLLLGAKRSGKRYIPEDMHVFSVLANQSALAIENARLYESMEEQVRQRTSQLVEVQKQLIQAEKLATVGTLAGGVAHEINNPLTAVLTNVQMLLSSVSHMDADTRESLALIEEATKRCRAIVQKLMAYAKKPLEASEVTAIDLAKAMKNVVVFLSYQLEQESVTTVMEEARGVCVVNGNANELEQLFTNLILNAKDAIRTVRTVGSIHISFSDNDDKIKVKITDDGCGIPHDIIAKIFDPFFTTKDVGKGLGLGLSICQSIIDKHGGSITVDSEVGRGSVFTVTLPKVKTKAGV